MKTKLVFAVGAFYVLLGLSVAVAPSWFLSVDWPSRQGLLIAAGIRFVVGTILLFGASATKFPRTIRVFGGIALAAGVLMPFFPPGEWAEYMGWWMENRELLRGTLAVMGGLFGALLVYAAMPRRVT